MKIIIKTLFLAIIVLVIACNESDDFCLSNQQSVQAGFYSAETGNDSTVSDVSFISLPGDGIILENDTLYNSESLSNSFLPLSMASDTTKYLVKILNQKDTITFIHSKELSFVSEECGFVFSFELDTVIYTDISFIDSVAIDYTSIKYNESTENVKIFLY
ncbi:DUF6452 family protein [Plebeiibacterium marinum]|uniref:DUF6452 family protein n=1 Tax=Plebeiibacterium marinum TaxID=2992111 RepID=A0AAE3SK12_9BACT|nr:DUF6452 family protein [Plebeiobacterium marinum]MCW3806033.1 DUF6452 family protein [Plebeiobacterium marinum]